MGLGFRPADPADPGRGREDHRPRDAPRLVARGRRRARHRAPAPFAEPARVARPVGFVAEFIRGTPLLVQLYFLFYVLPDLGILLSPLVAGVIGLGLHYGTYTSEVYRAGIDNVPRGQWEAAKACNLTRTQTWRHIILPQAIAADDPGARQLFHRHVQGDAAALRDHRARTDEPGARASPTPTTATSSRSRWSASSSSSSASSRSSLLRWLERRYGRIEDDRDLP